MGRRRVKADEGKVFTPSNIVDHMVEKLFAKRPPKANDRVLDPGCGCGAFIDGILRWCRRHNMEPPTIVGVELDPKLAQCSREKYREYSNVRIIEGDFLLLSKDVLGEYDFIIGNPPYISLEKLDPSLREVYKRIYKCAVGRFDTYMLFFEKALELLKPGGRLVFITPEKYLYTISAAPLRRILASYHVEEVELLDEKVFGSVLAYPAITVINKTEPRETRFVLRDSRKVTLILPQDGSPWLPLAYKKLFGDILSKSPYTLKDIAVRISAGVATGRDDVFVVPSRAIPEELRPYAYPTVSGEELLRFRPGEAIDYSKLNYVMLVPYDRNGRLISEDEAKPLINYLMKYKKVLEDRYCVKRGKKWYAFHEDPPMKDLLKPKILWSDLAKVPAFYADLKGLIIPRHNVYYMVPKDPAIIPELLTYLNSDEVRTWLEVHCQRAANGYLRLQSSVLKRLPIPKKLYLKAHKQSVLEV